MIRDKTRPVSSHAPQLLGWGHLEPVCPDLLSEQTARFRIGLLLASSACFITSPGLSAGVSVCRFPVPPRRLPGFTPVAGRGRVAAPSHAALQRGKHDPAEEPGRQGSGPSKPSGLSSRVPNAAKSRRRKVGPGGGSLPPRATDRVKIQALYWRNERNTESPCARQQQHLHCTALPHPCPRLQRPRPRATSRERVPRTNFMFPPKPAPRPRDTPPGSPARGPTPSVG